MSRLVSLHDFIMAARSAIVKSAQQIVNFNEELLKGYYDPETGKPLSISMKMPELQLVKSTGVSFDVPSLAISPLSWLGLSVVHIALELWVLKVDDVIYVTIPSEIDQNPNISSTKVNFSLVVNPSQSEDEFSKELRSAEAEVANQIVA